MRNIKYINILMVLLIFFIIIVNANCVKAEDSEEIYNGIKYKVNTEEKWATVCGYVGTESDVTIPSIIGKGIIVSEIQNNAFDGCDTIKILTIPDTIMKVGDMSFIGMNNLQAIISKTSGINIVVKQNVKIVSDRSDLDTNADDKKEDTSNDNPSKDNSNNQIGKKEVEEVKAVDDDKIIDSNNNIVIDESSNSTLTDGNTDNKVSEGSATISGSDNKKNNNKSTQAGDSKNETGSKTTKKSSAPKIIAYIVCVIVIIGFAAGAIVFIKKKRR